MAQISEDKKLGVWRAPYVNSFFDTRLVRRSNMLQADLVLLGLKPLEPFRFRLQGAAFQPSRNEPYGLTFNFTEFAMLPPERVAHLKAGIL